jgi:membrane-bound lytic murein transglycosylase B
MRRSRLPSLLLCTSLLGACATGTAKDPEVQGQVEAFVSQMVEVHGSDAEQLKDILAQAQNVEDVIRPKFEGAAETSWTWTRYRKVFVNPTRIQNGTRYWKEHRALFEKAERELGIPQPILAAIVGVETNYGKRPGRIRVLDVLYTQAFHYPERARFGRKELEAFLLLATEEAIDPLVVSGSYAGAMGQPQFIPSSYRSYALDFDNDGRRDLWDSDADVIGSVANYFKRHGWREGEPIAAPAADVQARHADLTVRRGQRPQPPTQTVGQLRQAGIRVDKALADSLDATLIALDSDDRLEHWVGLYNFYVITRYNHSYFYAMAVYQLSRELAARMGAG